MANNCPALYAFDQSGVIVPVYCGRWTCPRCAKRNARLWSWRAAIQLSHGSDSYFFITLTLGRKYTSVSKAFVSLARIWDTIRTWVRRHSKFQKWHYLAFVEGQPKRSGMPHFHILSNLSITLLAKNDNKTAIKKRYGGRSVPRLQDLCVSFGLGFEAKESPVTGKKAAQYVAKYSSKQHPSTPRNFRRVRASRGWAKLPPHESGTLYVKSRSEHVAEYILRVSGATGVSPDTLYERWDGRPAL